MFASPAFAQLCSSPSAAGSGLPAVSSGAELLAAQMVAADPAYARQIAESLARDLLERIPAGRRVDRAVRELVVALRRALSEPPSEVPQPEPRDAQGADSLSIEQVAQTLGCSAEYARRLARKGADGGGIKASRVGATWVVRAADLDEYIERRRRKEPAA
ncbi:MAG TPA: helix-turn-helix domain-containing protein [Actinomycetes bacterium]